VRSCPVTTASQEFQGSIHCQTIACGVHPRVTRGTVAPELSYPFMPAPTTDQASARRSLLNFRVAPGERQQLQQLATEQGVPLSELIRRGLQSQGFEPLR
jgi:hypothetical protein